MKHCAKEEYKLRGGAYSARMGKIIPKHFRKPACM